jgi:DNA (cytosine-5)-methyltransferase 1
MEFEDVRHITAESLLARCGCLPDVVVGSPPCQDASVANHAGRGIDGARTGLFSEFIRIVGEVQPVWCAAENVSGLRTRGLDRVVSNLEGAGYHVDVLDIGAENLGAPHRRRRLWIIGTRRDIADADEERQHPFGWTASGGRRGPDAQRDDSVGSGAGAGIGADADSAGLEIDPSEPGHDGAQQPALVGVDWLDAWASWHGGCARHLKLADGVGSVVARPLVAAIGDAVCPAIPEAIGRAMTVLAGGETFVDLFSGAVGGWTIGLEAAGMRCLAYAEADPWRRSIYAAARAA